MNKRFAIKTFGCQMNISDSERIAGYLEPMGWEEVDYEADPELVILNTCSIRQKAEDRVIGLIHNLGKKKKQNPNLRVGVTGCMVRHTGIRRDLLVSENEKLVSDDKLFGHMPALDFVFRIEDTCKLGEYIDEIRHEPLISSDFSTDSESLDPEERYENSVHKYLNVKPHYKNKAQIMVPIMTGCDHFCSYCIVPFTRGREISRPLSRIVEEVQIAADNGCKEVTLLGQNVNSYQTGEDLDNSFRNQKDKKSDFVKLIEAIDAIPGITRIRYTSSHPRDFDDDLIEAHVNLESMCDYVHLPVQAGDNEVLKNMKREYKIEEYYEKMKRLKDAIPNVALSTDIIVGFCGETQEQFENTLKMVRDIEFDLIYLAQYSARKGTFADKMLQDDVPHEEKYRRWHALNDLLAETVHKKNQRYQDQTVEVLVEEKKRDIYIGKSRESKIVQFTSDREDLIGEEVDVKITSPKTWILEGVEVAPSSKFKVQSSKLKAGSIVPA